MKTPCAQPAARAQPASFRFPPEWANLKVVLCHDWLTGMRGGERVLEILCQAFPQAPIVTLFYNPDSVSDIIRSHRVLPSWLQRIPGITRHYRAYLPLFPSAIQRIATPPADLLISTSHCVAKGVRTQAKTRHLCYCFTPMRYAWTCYEEYFGNSYAKAAAARLLLPALRAWDKKTAPGVDRFVAISEHIRTRIQTFYQRDADLVFPPVNTEWFTPARRPREDFDLVVSALVPYKRVDLAVRAYSAAQRRLKVAGSGSERKRLQALAGPTIEFLGPQSDAEIRQLYRSARLLVFPGEEDFGIVPLEAQACGCPVTAFRKGGATETVVEGVTGEFFDHQEAASLLAAAHRCARRVPDADAIRAHAEQFSVNAFSKNMTAAIQDLLNKKIAGDTTTFA